MIKNRKINFHSMIEALSKGISRFFLVMPAIEIPPTSTAVSTDSKAMLDCYSSRAEWIKWMKDDVELTVSGRINFLPNGSLEITEFTEEDNGNYMCVAANPTGNVSSEYVYTGLIRKFIRARDILAKCYPRTGSLAWAESSDQN